MDGTKAGVNARKPTQLDARIGSRIRIARQNRGLSQTRLADQIGVTFQQIQKYERGTNRIAASRLVRAAEALNLPLLFFYETDDVNYPANG